MLKALMETSQKIKTREQIKDLLTALHADKKATGFTSGAFDLLHSGHVDYLEKARSQCDCLIVAVNSDSSIKQYKSEKRPVMKQERRARLIAGLACVDYVFIFDELNNNQNIEILKPKIYFKAADYNKSKLSSAPIIEAYGGKVSLIELTPDCSTTSIIEDILSRFDPVYSESVKISRKEKAPAIFLDRDGTLIEHVEYMHEVSKLKIIPGVPEALKRFQDAGFRLIIVTNQPGIGMGYFTKEDLFLVNKEMLRVCSSSGAKIDKIYYCPHSKADGCNCRKPNTGMIDRALSEMNIDISKSFVIGDTTMDVQLGKNAGCGTILVETGLAGRDGVCDVKADYTAANLSAAADIFLSDNIEKKIR